MSAQTDGRSNVVCKISSLFKSYNSQAVLQSCTFSLFASQTTLLLGPNGAGKTTLLRILAELTRADAGIVDWQVDGVGYLSQDLMLYDSLTVAENLNFFGSLNTDSSEASVEAWGLDRHKDKAVSTLSKGLQRRVALCRFFARSYKFYLMDEPTAFLDLEGVDTFSSELQAIKSSPGSPGILIATHDVSSLSEFADRAMMVDSGKIAMDSNESASVDSIVEAYRMGNR